MIIKKLFPTLLLLACSLTVSAEKPLKIQAVPLRGFVISNGDQVLAYGDTPLDTATACPPFRWWMKSMEKVLTSDAIETLATTLPDPAKYPTSVAPMLTTKWGQKPPYNYMCPLVEPTPWGGYLPDEQHCLVGCVAVAMGQIMRYHRWPLCGKGEHTSSYQGISLPGDFGNTTYDWDNMLDDYYASGYTETQGRAVAQLLYHCAVSTNMLFNEDWSFSTNFSASDALIDYFGYNPEGVKTYIRYFYSEKKWMDMVYKELSEGRPIFYEALDKNGSGAHSFVIDGYNSQGLVHVNWGWYGHQNGYYDISLLNPGSDQYSAYQDMTIGIRPLSDTSVILLHPSNSVSSADVYDLNGRIVRKQASSLQGLPAGTYIWQGRKLLVKEGK